MELELVVALELRVELALEGVARPQTHDLELVLHRHQAGDQLRLAQRAQADTPDPDHETGQQHDRHITAETQIGRALIGRERRQDFRRAAGRNKRRDR